MTRTTSRSMIPRPRGCSPCSQIATAWPAARSRATYGWLACAGKPAERRLVGLAAVAGRQRQVADARRRHGVVEEHLVEVAEPEEEDGVLVLRLDAEVLREQRASHTRFFFFAR